jgi:hypothetical protein
MPVCDESQWRVARASCARSLQVVSHLKVMAAFNHGRDARATSSHRGFVNLSFQPMDAPPHGLELSVIMPRDRSGAPLF